MTNYNLTFNEAIAAAAAGKIIENNFYKTYLYKYEDGNWLSIDTDLKNDQWNTPSFFENEITAKWRIAPQVLKETMCTDSHLMLLERRVSELEEKHETTMKLVNSLVDKVIVAGADIKTLYGICDNHEEVIVSYEEKLTQFGKRLEERHEQWDEGSYAAIVRNMNHVHWENLSIEKRLEVLESTFLMKIDFDERLTNLEAMLKINDKESYGGTE